MKKFLLSFVLMIFMGITCFAYPSLNLKNKNLSPQELLNIMSFLRTAVGTQYELNVSNNGGLSSLANFDFLKTDRNLKILSLAGCGLESRRSEIEAAAANNSITIVW